MVHLAQVAALVFARLLVLTVLVVALVQVAVQVVVQAADLVGVRLVLGHWAGQFVGRLVRLADWVHLVAGLVFRRGAQNSGLVRPAAGRVAVRVAHRGVGLVAHRVVVPAGLTVHLGLRHRSRDPSHDSIDPVRQVHDAGLRFRLPTPTRLLLRSLGATGRFLRAPVPPTVSLRRQNRDSTTPRYLSGCDRSVTAAFCETSRTISEQVTAPPLRLLRPSAAFFLASRPTVLAVCRAPFRFLRDCRCHAIRESCPFH